MVFKVLRLFVKELRLIFRRRKAEYYEQFPNAARCCETCAFNPSTDDWEGADKTAYSLMRAIRDDAPFYCHENIPWKKDQKAWTPQDHRHFKENAKLCAGYALVTSDPGAKLAFVKSCQNLKAIDLAAAAIPGAGEILK